ncbi:MAG: hypothetical protein IPK88_07520 [Saprospiraceae bacterium]|nr:hypothetical protein [Candidatus Defluviibacterium haderslevense]
MENIYDINARVRYKLDQLTEKDGLNIKWPTLSKLIHSKIHELKCIKVKEKTHHTQWNKIHNGVTDKRLDYPWWQEFEIIVDSILNDLQKDKKEITNIFLELEGSRRIIEKKINYGIFANQDSYIPKVFEATYKQVLPNIKFRTLQNWSNGLFALNENNINTTLIDFATAIAIRAQLVDDGPIIFWPFFDFTGWYILIKKAALARFCKISNIRLSDFRGLTKVQKREFLETQKIVVERKTDFEWVIKKFCKLYDCNESNINGNIVDIDTNMGKIDFIKIEENTIYCTNPLNVTDIIIDDKYENVDIGISHRNVNGLLCKESYYKENQAVIHRLIKNWYYDIQIFVKEISELNKSKHYRDPDFEPSFTIQNLVRELVNGTKTNITLEDLPILYEHKNLFFKNAQEGFDVFYNNILNNDLLINNYVGIAKLKFDGDLITEDYLKKIVEETKNNMIKIFLR